MTKEEWENLRGKPIPEIPMQIWFNYFKDNVTKPRTYSEFVTAFQEMASRSEMVVKGTDGGIKKITAASAIRRLNEYYDKKFGL